MGSNVLSPRSARDAPAHGGPHAHDAGTPNDETPLPPHDGANSAGNDPSRQIKGEAEPPFLVRVMIFCTIKCRRPRSLGFCIKLVCRGNLLLDRRGLHPALVLLYLLGVCLFGFPPTLNGKTTIKHECWFTYESDWACLSMVNNQSVFQRYTEGGLMLHQTHNTH